MTIDPSNFEAKGAPTVEQVRAVWESTPAPSARRVTEILLRRGFSINFRTVARYKASDWKARDEKKQTNRPTPQQRAALDRELEVIQTSAETPGPRPPADGPLDPVEQAFIKRDAELMEMSENALRKLEAKKRIITNIHLLEAASRKAGVMILVPKETAALVSSMTEAANASVSTGKADGLPQPGDGAKDVTNRSQGEILDLQPNPQADTIARFRRKLSGGG